MTPPLDGPRLAALGVGCAQARSWPLPGGGRTGERLDALAAGAFADLVVGRLIEAHADAVAITAELGAEGPAAGERWGVWAAGPTASLTARPEGDGVRLSGSRPWCSGATLLTHALVTAQLEGGDGPGVLCRVALDAEGSRPDPPSWTGPGMADADTRTVRFAATAAVVVGPPGAYLTRPGFWAGAVGVAACWFGGAARLATALRRRAAGREADPHTLAHLGRVHAVLGQARATLGAAAAAIDADPGGDHRLVARATRSTVERAAAEVTDRVGRALGPSPLAHDTAHAQLVADLAVYVRQEHAERDLEALGRDVVASLPSWCPGDDPSPPGGEAPGPGGRP
jgi:hypothetical protein